MEPVVESSERSLIKECNCSEGLISETKAEQISLNKVVTQAVALSNLGILGRT